MRLNECIMYRFIYHNKQPKYLQELETDFIRLKLGQIIIINAV